MAGYINFAATLKTSRSAAISTAVGASGKLLLYTGAHPASPDSAATGTLLVTLPCSATFGSASGGVLTLNAISSATAVGTGTAGWARVTLNDGTTGIIDFDVTVTGSGGYLQMANTSITAGDTVTAPSTNTITEA